MTSDVVYVFPLNLFLPPQVLKIAIIFNNLVGGRKKSSKDTYSSSLYNALLYIPLKGAG